MALPKDQNQRKRIINQRLQAFQAAGRDPDSALDSVLRLEGLTDSMRGKIKQARASGQSQQAFDSLLQLTSGAGPEPVDTEISTGPLGGAARFLGMEDFGKGLGARLARLDPQHRRNLETIAESNPAAAEELKTGGVNTRQMIAGGAMTGLNLAGGAALGAIAKGAGATGRFLNPMRAGARALNPAQKAGRIIASPAMGPVAVGRALATRAPIRTGMALGAASGAASGLGEEQFNPMETGLRALGGAAVGGALGAIPGISRAVTGQSKKQMENLLKKVTPDFADLTPTQRKQYVRSGRVTPRTLTKAQQVQLTDNEVATAVRNSDIITDDPIQTSLNISDRIQMYDGDVEQFLLQNNGIFNRNELKSALTKSMDDIVDLSGVGTDEAMNRAKEKLVKQFIDELDSKDMHSLWRARKAFDQRIDSAFTGAPSLQKEVKKALRNAVQDFIAQKTPNNTYKTYMKDMSNLFNLQDLVDISVGKQYAGSRVGETINRATRGLGYLGTAAGGIGAGLYLAGGGGGGSND